MAINPVQITNPAAVSLVDQGQWNTLANLGNIYREAKDRESLAALGRDLAEGKITYQQAAGRVGETGNIGAALKFLDLAEARRLQDFQIAAANDFNKSMQGLYGGGGGASRAAAPAAEPTQQTAALPPREPVEEIPGVVRTNPDGSIAGNLTAPSIPAQQPQPAPGTPIPVPRPVAAGPGAPPPPMQPPPPVPGDTASLPPQIAGAQAAGADMLPPEVRLPILMRAAASPFLPTPQRDVAKSLLTETLSELKPHERVQYLQAMKDSDPANANKTLYQIEMELKKAGQPTVTIANERAQAAGVGKELADIQVNAIKQGLQASKTLGTLDIMERAAKDPNFYSGAFSPAVLAYNRGASSLGFEAPEKAVPTEVFQKMGNKLVTDVLAGEKGGAGLGTGVSNADRDFIRDTVPNLANTREGNLAIIQIQRALAQRDAEIAQMTRDYARTHDGLINYEFLQKVADYQQANPIFANFKLPEGAVKAKVGGFTRDQLEAEALRRGMRPP